VGLIQSTKAPNPIGTCPLKIHRCIRVNIVIWEPVGTLAWPTCGSPREIGNLLPNNQRQRRTCYALCHILYPVSAAEDDPLDVPREPSALEGWTLEVLYCDPKGSRAFLRILSTEGRGVRLCWEHSKPKGPKGHSHSVGFVVFVGAGFGGGTRPNLHHRRP